MMSWLRRALARLWSRRIEVTIEGWDEALRDEGNQLGNTPGHVKVSRWGLTRLMIFGFPVHFERADREVSLYASLYVSSPMTSPDLVYPKYSLSFLAHTDVGEGGFKIDNLLYSKDHPLEIIPLPRVGHYKLLCYRWDADMGRATYEDMRLYISERGRIVATVVSRNPANLYRASLDPSRAGIAMNG